MGKWVAKKRDKRSHTDPLTVNSVRAKGTPEAFLLEVIRLTIAQLVGRRNRILELEVPSVRLSPCRAQFDLCAIFGIEDPIMVKTVTCFQYQLWVRIFARTESWCYATVTVFLATSKRPKRKSFFIELKDRGLTIRLSPLDIPVPEAIEPKQSKKKGGE